MLLNLSIFSDLYAIGALLIVILCIVYIFRQKRKVHLRPLNIQGHYFYRNGDWEPKMPYTPSYGRYVETV